MREPILQFLEISGGVIGHVEVAMRSNMVYENVHCIYCWLTDQSQGRLIQVHTLTEAGIIDQKERRSLSMTNCLPASRS